MKRLLIGAAVASLLASPVFAQSGGGVVTVPPSPYTQACGPVSVSTVCWGVTETWTNAGTTYAAPLQVNVTNTASTAGSLVFDVQVGGVSLFNVGTQSIAGRAAVSLPANSTINWASAAGSLNLASSSLTLTVNSSQIALFNGSVSGGRLELAVKSIRITAVTVAGLPASPVAGEVAFVTDSNATTFNAIVAGGGANQLPVHYDGTNWRIG